jgi:hypothetical protein
MPSLYLTWYVASLNVSRLSNDHNTGAVTTVAGDGSSGFNGDGGQATSERPLFCRRRCIREYLLL